MKILLLKISTLIAVLMPLALANVYAADCQASSADAITCGVQSASGNNESPGQATTKANTTITKIVNLASAIVGAVAVIMLIYGGFKYITSGGDETGAKSARNTIIYAVVGLVIVALAQFIVKFVINNVGQ
jgi:uncharacterized membrane protein